MAPMKVRRWGNRKNGQDLLLGLAIPLGVAGILQAQPDVGAAGVLVLILALVVVLVGGLTLSALGRNPGPSDAERIGDVLDLMEGMQGRRRLDALRRAMVDVPRGITVQDANRLLGDMRGSTRRDGLLLLASRIQRPIRSRDVSTLASGLDSYDREQVIEALMPITSRQRQG